MFRSYLPYYLVNKIHTGMINGKIFRIMTDFGTKNSEQRPAFAQIGILHISRHEAGFFNAIKSSFVLFKTIKSDIECQV